MHPRILVVDCYKRQEREVLVDGHATTAGEQYVRMLSRVCPEVICDILFPCDTGTCLSAGTSLESYDGIAWTGSLLSVYDGSPVVTAQIEFARACFEAGVPSFGSCWAAQVAVVAAGGLCRANPNGREMGIARKITLTREGRGHPLYEGKASVFDAFIIHEDEITHLPPGGVALSGNAFTSVQSISVAHKGGVFWGLQYHPEYSLHEMARLTWCRMNKLLDLGFFRDRQAGEEYVKQLEQLHKNQSRIDIAWLLGIDSDVMNDDVRQIEARNWIYRLVIPTMMAKVGSTD